MRTWDHPPLRPTRLADGLELEVFYVCFTIRPGFRLAKHLVPPRNAGFSSDSFGRLNFSTAAYYSCKYAGSTSKVFDEIQFVEACKSRSFEVRHAVSLSISIRSNRQPTSCREPLSLSPLNNQSLDFRLDRFGKNHSYRPDERARIWSFLPVVFG
jgi:hypothetical protein